MNKLNLAALTLFAAGAAGVAFADDISIDSTAQNANSGLTRAEVLAELQQARADGRINLWAEDYNPMRRAVSSVPTTPATERNAAFAAAMSGEDSGSFALSQMRQPQQAGPWLAGFNRWVR